MNATEASWESDERCPLSVLVDELKFTFVKVLTKDVSVADRRASSIRNLT